MLLFKMPFSKRALLIKAFFQVVQEGIFWASNIIGFGTTLCWYFLLPLCLTFAGECKLPERPTNFFVRKTEVLLPRSNSFAGEPTSFGKTSTENPRRLSTPQNQQIILYLKIPLLTGCNNKSKKKLCQNIFIFSPDLSIVRLDLPASNCCHTCKLTFCYTDYLNLSQPWFPFFIKKSLQPFFWHGLYQKDNQFQMCVHYSMYTIKNIN